MEGRDRRISQPGLHSEFQDDQGSAEEKNPVSKNQKKKKKKKKRKKERKKINKWTGEVAMKLRALNAFVEDPGLLITTTLVEA